MAASLGATLSYALGALYVRKAGAGTTPTAVAGWSQLAGGAALLPWIVWDPRPAPVPWSEPVVIGNVLALGIVCSGLAYLLYYRLIRDVGPTRTATVTFLIPVFALVWAIVFLGEHITGAMLLGCALVLAGTLLVLRRPS